MTVRALIIAWGAVLTALVAFLAWLWFTPLPADRSAPARPAAVVQGEPVDVTTGVITLDIAKAKQDEDCPSSC